MEPGAARQRDFPLWAVAAGTSVGVLLFLLLAWNLREMRHAFTEVESEALALQHVIDRVDYYDEALTTTANLVAATGDARWSRRYQALIVASLPDFMELLRRLEGLGHGGVAAELRAVADTLAVLEDQAVGLAERGETARARDLLESPGYAVHKQRYAARMTDARRILGAHVAAHTRDFSGRLVGNFAIAALGVTLMLLLGVVTREVVRRYVRRRAAMAEVLERSHTELERRVEERTAELAALNSELTREIAERVQAEAALRESRETLSTLLDHLPGMAYRCRVDEEWTMVFASEGALGLTGYPGTDLLWNRRVSFERLIHPDDRVRVRDAVVRVIGSGEAFRIEYRIRTRDGAEKWVWEQGREVSSAGGVPVLAGLVIDVSERKRAEHALQASEARFRSLMRNALDMVTILGEDGTVRYASRSVEVHLGIRRREHAGAQLFDLLHPDDVEKARETIAASIRDPGTPCAMEVRIRHAAGSWRIHEAVCTNLLNDPAVRGLVVNSRDVTERRQLEEELRHAQKMEAVGRLAGGIAHDFNNLLTAIGGFAHLLRLELEALDDGLPEAEECLEGITRSAQRAAELTRQLLAFGRKQVLDSRVVDLNETIGKMRGMLRRLIEEDVTIVTRLAPDLGRIRVDPGQLEQVLLNLAVNARDAMPGGGTLAVETSNRAVRGGGGDAPHFVRPGSYVQLRVRDTGTGMASEVLDRVFEPFFTTKEQGKGTGLGLSTVYGIVKQSGGYVLAESEIGGGSTFDVLLPRVDESPAPELPEASELPSGRGRVLLVEDEPAVRHLARRVLERSGYAVIEAADGEEAIRRFEESGAPVDLLLTDLVMPGMSGRALAERLTALSPGLPVVFMSGYPGDAFADGGPEGSPSYFLQKPFAPALLADHVRQALHAAATRPAPNPEA